MSLIRFGNPILDPCCYPLLHPRGTRGWRWFMEKWHSADEIAQKKIAVRDQVGQSFLALDCDNGNFAIDCDDTASELPASLADMTLANDQCISDNELDADYDAAEELNLNIGDQLDDDQQMNEFDELEQDLDQDAEEVLKRKVEEKLLDGVVVDGESDVDQVCFL